MVREPTPQEETLWTILEPMGFERQMSVFSARYNKGWILDFCHPEQLLAIEVDGPCHQKVRDQRRDRKLAASLGIRTLRFSNKQIRFSNKQVERDLEAVRKKVLEALG